MKTLVALSTSALLLAGCASSVTNQQEDSIVENLVGKPSSYAQKALGLPNRRQENKSGSEVWAYDDNSKGMAATDCTVTLSIRNDVIEKVAIAKDGKSLLSLVSNACQRIRNTLQSSS